MGFLLRTVSHSAEGREIVRTLRIDGDRLEIGRDPDCDVHLTDLAVALRHATVERKGGRLEVRAASGLTVALDGRKTDRGYVELAGGGDIVLASHALRFLPAGADADDIAVTVERIESGAAKLDRTAERLFTLSPVMPGKRGMAWLLTLLVLAVGLGWPIKSHYDRQRQPKASAAFHADRLWSSGSLSQAHAGLAGDCAACHVKPFEAVRDAACKSCHVAVHDHAPPEILARVRPEPRGWQRVELAFKKTFDIPAGRCVECHSEHEGPREMPVTAQRFCSDCHGNLSSRLPATKLGDAADFGRAHPEFQPAVITGWAGPRPRVERVSMSASPREMSNLKFPHDLHLSRTGGVAQMARRLGADHGFGSALQCSDCHVPTPDGTRFQSIDMEEDCAMCHSLAFDRAGGTLRTLRHGAPDQVIADLRDFYRGRRAAPPPSLSPAARRRPGAGMESRARIQFARGAVPDATQAIRAVFSPGGACHDCHQVEAPPPGSLAYSIRPVAFPVRYLHKGWFDHRPHATQSCSTCHAADRSGAATDLLIPDLKSCRSCHGGEGSASRVPSSCATCHDYHMDAGKPSMLIRRQVRGKRRDATPFAGEGR